MKTPQEGGRISDHAHGLGSVTGEMVTQRARELAAINGHDGKVTEADWLQAKSELLGRSVPDETKSDEPVFNFKEWDESIFDKGRMVENSPPRDEETDAERLVQEGMEEANHDRMLKGSQSDSSSQ